MAIKLKRNNELADRPLLTEKEIKFIIDMLQDWHSPDDEQEIFIWQIVAKLKRCEWRINKLKLN